MSRSLRATAVAVMLAAAALLLPAAAPAEPTRLTLLHINDVYEIAPVRGAGGFAPLMTLLRQERAAAPDSLTTVGGDFLSPSLMSGVTQGSQMIALFNALGVDYVAFGNHEFDFGPEVTARRIVESEFPWIGTNVLGPDGAPFGGAVATATEEVGDHTVGLFGLLTPETATLSSPGPDVTFAPVLESAARAVAALRDEGAEVIIALTHLTLAEDRALAREVEGIDVILGGHDHDPASIYENGVLILKAGHDAHYLGVVELTIDRIAGRRGPEVSVRPAWRMVPTAGVAPDPGIAALVQQFNAALDTALGVTIGTTTVELDSRRGTVRRRESGMGNLIADAIREGVHADIAIVNGGGIRGDRLYPAGTALTRRDIQAELPFGNVTVLLGLPGAVVREALEHGVSKVEDEAGRFPQVSGLTVRYDPSKPAGSRIVDLQVGGAPLDPARIYRVATNDYMARGGDGYTMLAGATPIVDASGATLMASMVMNYVAAKGNVAPAIGNRIVRAQ